MTLQQVNEAIWYGRLVSCNGIQYKATAIIKRKDKKKPEWCYDVVLQDLKVNSTTIAKPEQVKEVAT